VPALTHLSLTNFRSYARQDIDLNPGVTVVVGPNASGKTNLLESLYVLATTKSFRARDTELVKHDESFYRIVAKTSTSDYSLGYQEKDGSSQKKITHSGASRSLINHIGTIQAVLFEPDDLLIINGAPDRRRRYLDHILSQTDKAYLKTLHNYRRVLQQRNTILSNWRGDKNDLFAWDLKLAEHATEIINRRQELLTYINELVRSLYHDFTGLSEEIRLVYVNKTGAKNIDEFVARLQSNLSRDLGAGFTTTGPHRDDFVIEFKGSGVGTVASRGEIRTIVLALKMAELAYTEQQTDQKPLLLLDDVFSELDENRRVHLLSSLHDHQTIITTTSADSISGEIEAGYTLINTLDMQNA
jgi:DNA replication and repair protein RecF